jgi:hypothetical protein
MIPDRTDPERRLSIEERVTTATSQFERGAISEAVFRATLFAVGVREFDIDQAVRSHRPFVPLHEATRRVINGFVSGLA